MTLGCHCRRSVVICTGGGFTPQKPLTRAYERDREALAHWPETEYPKIRTAANRVGAAIYWADETAIRSDHQVGTSWAPKGNTPVVPGTGRRFKCNMISAVTNRGHLRFMLFDGRFSGDLMIRFMKRLSRGQQRPVFVIVDGHPVHRSAN